VTAELPEAFLAWYSCYPRKVGRPAALKAWNRAMKVATPEEVVDGLIRHLPAFLAQKERGETQFIPHPATWLNQERWNDDPPPVPSRLARHVAPVDGLPADLAAARAGTLPPSARERLQAAIERGQQRALPSG